MTVEGATDALRKALAARDERTQELQELGERIVEQVAAQFRNHSAVVQNLGNGAVQISLPGHSQRYARLTPKSNGRVLFVSTHGGQGELLIYEDAMKAVVNALYQLDTTRSDPWE